MALRIFSYDSQKVRDHGPIRIQVGKKPLYRAQKPSFRTVFMKQSTDDL